MLVMVEKKYGTHEIQFLKLPDTQFLRLTSDSPFKDSGVDKSVRNIDAVWQLSESGGYIVQWTHTNKFYLGKEKQFTDFSQHKRLE